MISVVFTIVLVNHECKTSTYVLIEENFTFCSITHVFTKCSVQKHLSIYWARLNGFSSFFFLFSLSFSSLSIFFFWGGGGTGDTAGLRNDVFLHVAF